MNNLKEGFIICDNEVKKNIILEAKGFKNYIFLTPNDLASKLYGRANVASEVAICERYGLGYEEANEILSYLPYITKAHYNNPKLDSLVTIKDYLIASNLYTANDLFKSRLAQFPVTFIYPDGSKKTQRLIEEVKEYTEVYMVDLGKTEYSHRVKHFKTRSDECLYVMNTIYDLLASGVDINKIVLTNIDGDYEFILKRMSRTYGIPISFTKRSNILSTDFAAKVLFELNNSESFEELLLKLENESPYYNKLIDIINRYRIKSYPPKSMYEFIKLKLKEMQFEGLEYKNAVRVSNSYKFKDDEYVFFLGFNLGSAPRSYNDDKYLSDKELELIDLDTSYDRNVLEKDLVRGLVLHTKNLYISYKDSDSKDDYEPSILIAELGMMKEEPVIGVGYSPVEDDLRLSLAFDALLKYKTDSELFKYDINHIKYNSYDNKFKGIVKERLNKRFSQRKLKLSYSSMKTYLACPFSYFADRILYLNEFVPNMAARLGSYSHGVLEDSYKAGFNFDASVIARANEYAEDSKDRFYFNKMIDTLRALVDFNRTNEGKSRLDNVTMEPNIVYDREGFLFEGYVDKLLYTIIDNDVYAVIIDYKTGKDIASLDNVEDGFNLQLPSYVFLLSNYEPFKNKNINLIGIYLQKVNMIALKGSENIEAQRNKSFMLQGYTINEYELLNLFDPEYYQSPYIYGMKTLKDGQFAKSAKLIKREDVDMLRELVEATIHASASGIQNGEFKIAPKEIDGKNQSCMFCKYNDICYRTIDDVVSLTKKPFGSSEEDEHGVD